MTANCEIVTGTGITGTVGGNALGSFTATTAADNCIAITGTTTYAKVLCDPTCAISPVVNVYPAAGCGSGTETSTGVEVTLTGGTYTCGDGGTNCGGQTCSVTDSPTTAAPTTATGAPTTTATVSGASSLKGSVIVGMMAAILTAMAMM